MKILYLIDNFSLGGAQTIVQGLMENAKNNLQIHAIALRQKQPDLKIDHPNALIFQSSSKYSFRVLGFLKDFISKNKIEVLHCQLPRSIVMGYLLKRAFPEIKYIIHEQGDVFESRAYAMLLRIIWKKADGILTCSKASAEVLTRRAHVNPKSILVLYNFVDLQRFCPLPNLSFNGQKIAFAGRIEKRKGWREYIKAASYLKELKGLSFYLAGTGTEVKKLERYIRKQKDVDLNYMGFQADMKAFYGEMDLLVIPSHFEPMGMVAVEAMACGIPVLATNVPGLNEVVNHGENGWTYPALSASELAKAIEKILKKDPKQINAIAAKGIEHALEFSLQKFATRLQEFHSALN